VKPLFSGEEKTFYVESWQPAQRWAKNVCSPGGPGMKDNRGNVTGALSSAQDITRAQTDGRGKEKFTKELAEKNTELERFTYTVSHRSEKPAVGHNQDLFGIS